MKFLSLAILLAPFLSYGQEVKMTKFIDLGYFKHDPSYYINPEHGFFMISKDSTGKRKDYIASKIDENFELEWQNKLTTKILTKKVGYLGFINNHSGVRLYYYKSKLAGLYARSMLYELRFTGGFGNVEQTKFKTKNAIRYSGLLEYNNRILLLASERYRPWTPQRIIKYALPASLLVVPNPSGLLIAAGIVGGLSLTVPAVSRTRPAIIEVKKGGVNYINRERYMQKEYKNKGVHAVYDDNGEALYVGLTNTIKAGKNPIIIEKLSPSLKVIQKGVYKKDERFVVDGFEFAPKEGDTVYYRGSFGDKLAKSMGVRNEIGRKESKSKRKSFEGYAYAKSDKKLNVKLKTTLDKAKNRGLNNQYSSLTQIQYNLRKYDVEIDNQLFEITLNERLYPQILHSDGGFVLLGYFANQLVVTIDNKTHPRIWKLVYDYDEFYHREDHMADKMEIMHSCINVIKDQIYLTYLSKMKVLKTARIDLSTGAEIINEKELFPGKKIAVPNEKVKGKYVELDNTASPLTAHIEAWSEKSFAVVSIHVAPLKGTKKDYRRHYVAYEYQITP